MHPTVVESEFAYTEDVGFGQSVFMVGDAEVLGGGDPARGIKMRYTAGNVWRANVAVPLRIGELNYEFVSRSTAPSNYCDSENSTILSTGLTLPAHTPEAAPYSGKTVYYHSSWAQANILYWSESAGQFVEEAMTDVGPGRDGLERLYKISGIADAGRDLVFVFNDGTGQWDNAFGQSGVNYETNLGFVFVQDGHVYNYQPAPAVSAPRFESLTVASTAEGIAGRTIKVYLPRGYDSHPTKRYPVLYMHDGQNVFSPGGAFGSWNTGLTASAEIQMGRVRECIIVAIDNTADRLSEYLPPTDNYNGEGRCDDYADFVINNLRPTLDVNYRTLNDRSHTLLMGSSFGGIATVYMAWAHADVFGKIGVLSPSWWAIPNLRNQMRDAAPRSERVFLYWGTEEASGSADASTWWPPFLDGYDVYLSQGYSVGGNLLTAVGCGLAHNEAAWASQQAQALRFLLDVNDAPNDLAYLDAKPVASISYDPAGSVSVMFPALSGFRYQLEAKADLTEAEPWGFVAEQRSDQFWEMLTFSDTLKESDAAKFYRIRVLHQ